MPTIKLTIQSLLAIAAASTCVGGTAFSIYKSTSFEEKDTYLLAGMFLNETSDDQQHSSTQKTFKCLAESSEDTNPSAPCEIYSINFTNPNKAMPLSSITTDLKNKASIITNTNELKHQTFVLVKASKEFLSSANIDNNIIFSAKEDDSTEVNYGTLVVYADINSPAKSMLTNLAIAKATIIDDSNDKTFNFSDNFSCEIEESTVKNTCSVFSLADYNSTEKTFNKQKPETTFTFTKDKYYLIEWINTNPYSIDSLTNKNVKLTTHENKTYKLNIEEQVFLMPSNESVIGQTIIINK